jgi:hypothetical protein
MARLPERDSLNHLDGGTGQPELKIIDVDPQALQETRQRFRMPQL